MPKTIAVIGGGAAGFFAALSAKSANPNCKVFILERSAKVLSKVKISGGGRCNVTNATFDNDTLSKNYPRGERFLRKAFAQFNALNTVEWFESRGVRMKTYPDHCIFPQSNTSQSIIDCFLLEAQAKNIEVVYQFHVQAIEQSNNEFFIRSITSETRTADAVIVTVGGQPKRSGISWVEALGHTIVEPVPSLFTFNMPSEPIKELMGNVVEKTTVKIEGTKLVGRGPLLVTHWGMSGPAILQLSAWGARTLADADYVFHVLINWLNDTTEESLRGLIATTMTQHGAKKMNNINPFPVTNRLWEFLLQRSEINPENRWNELGKKSINKLVNTLLNDRYSVSGKTTFKEEFVTAGGVSLSEIEVKTMESKIVRGLYFAGEVMDIDGITGGFNFQSAWTTGFIAGKNAALS
jgi:predicted Rossmann fold flavoprotein